MIQTNLEVTQELIIKLIDNHKVLDIPNFNKLQDYYEGKSAILDRVMEEGKPNNKLVANYPGYIVDMINGYAFGKPISYASQDEQLIKAIQDILNYNDEHAHNKELAKSMGIKGRAYELVYADEDGNLRLARLGAEDCIMVYDTAVNPEPSFAIRYYTISDILTDTNIDYAEVYTKDEIITFQSDGKTYGITERVPHYFGIVPVIEYNNNTEQLGDFEKVLSLIDAYDVACSNKVNDLDYFSDAYMYIVGMSGTTSEDVAEIRNKRILILDENGQAGFLIKPSNDSESEHVKDRLKSDIHKFSMTPDMTDEQFGNNASGVAMAYKLLGLENKATDKEANFKKGLQRRFEIICNFLNTKGSSFDFRDISITFTRNKPINELEAVQIANMLKGLVSEITVLQNIPQVSDVTEELERLEKEKEDYTDLDNLVEEDENMQ